jgi:hypothetical protein
MDRHGSGGLTDVAALALAAAICLALAGCW